MSMTEQINEFYQWSLSVSGKKNTTYYLKLVRFNIIIY